jgi:hypothetical protein
MEVVMFTSLYSLLVSRPQGLGYDSAWQKEADILIAAAQGNGK